MPVTPTYPGVYVEEIPSGVRTITGVATSITAFIGRARRGPTNEPVTVNSFGDFERAFGGLQEEYLMSYAVRDFFLNGGSTVIIVLLMPPNSLVDRQAAQAVIDAAQVVAKAATDVPNRDAAKKAADDASTAIQNDTNKSAEEKAAAKAVADAVDKAVAAGATPDDVKKAALPGPAILRLVGTTQGDALELKAADEGEWGNALAAHVDAKGNPVSIAQAPRGIIHHYAPLWIISVSGGAVSPGNDLRGTFSPRATCPT